MIHLFSRGPLGLVFVSSVLIGVAANRLYAVDSSLSLSTQLTSPKEDEQWSVGSRHYLTWVPATGKADTVRLAFSSTAGADWKTIADKAPNTGKYLWKVPDAVSTGCQIEISWPASRSPSRVQFSIIPSRQVLNYQWVNVTTTAAYAPRDGAGALVFRDHLWLLGGWSPADKLYFPRICNNEVWSSKDGSLWTLVKPNTFEDDTFDSTKDWEGRHTGGYAVYKNKLWIVGGDANQGHYHDDVWNSEDGRDWTWVNKGRGVPWGPRGLHYTLVFKDKIWVMGGQTMPKMVPSAEVFYRDVWNTMDGIDWMQVRPVEPYWPARGMIGGNVVFNGRMWILGGGTYDTPTTPFRRFFGDVWSSADGVHWRHDVKVAPWPPRQYHEVAVFDDRMWVLEGSNEPGVSRNDVWYSADGVNWYELPGTPWGPRHAASVFVHANALWMLGGSDRGKMGKDVWKLARVRRD